MKEKKKAKEELQRLAEERRAAKEKFEEKLRVIKEKIVDAKSQGVHYNRIVIIHCELFFGT